MIFQLGLNLINRRVAHLFGNLLRVAVVIDLAIHINQYKALFDIFPFAWFDIFEFIDSNGVSNKFITFSARSLV